MDQVSINLETRTQFGKGPNRRLRSSGKVPAIVYGLGKNSNVSVDPGIVKKLLLSEGGRNTLINVAGAGLDGKHALIKDYQVDPLSRNLLHVDFLEIDVTKKVEVTVLIHLVGKAAGAVDGGIVNMVSRHVDVHCFPNQIPKHIDVDISPLKIGDSIHLVDVPLPEGVERDSDYNPTIVTIVPPAKEEALQASLTPSAEPEVLTEKKTDEAGEAAAGDAKKDDKKDDKKEEKKDK